MRFKTLMKLFTVMVFTIASSNFIVYAETNTVCLKNAHAHNDYRHDRPLQDALEHGFKSVEADIFLKNGQLLVGHNLFELTVHRTLESLYLKPLFNRVNDNDGYVYKDKEELLLLIDFKNDGDKVYPVLDQLLDKYKSMLTSYNNGEVTHRAVKIIITGDRPWEMIINDKNRYVAIDGNIKHLTGNYSASVMPVVSENWNSCFSWKGNGPMPEHEYEFLKGIVSNAHKKGMIVRFWASPDKPSPQRTAIWQTLFETGVDLINTDDLDGLTEFLKSKQN